MRIRFAPDPAWYINTMTEVFAFGGKQVKPEVENNLIKMLSESQGDPAVDRELRCLAISQLYPLIRDMLAPENLVRVATWIFGEYGHLSKDPSLAEIVDALAAIWHRPALSIETKSYLLSAFMKISAQTQTIPTIASVMVRECVRSHDTELVQQAMEFREMCKSGADVFLAAIPTKAEPSLFIDSELHFLDSYVMQGRLSGMKDYEEHDLSDEEDTGLKTDAYEAPPEPVPVHVPAAERKAELKEDGFLDFSNISGSFGLQPAAPITETNPAAAALFGETTSSPATDLFSGMESTGSDLFGGMEVNEKSVEEPSKVEQSSEDKARVKEAAALFGGIAPSMPKKTKKPAFSPVAPANALFSAPAPVANSVPASAPAPVANPVSAPVATPASTTPEVDLFSGMSSSTGGDMFELVNLASPVPVEQPIDMLQCTLSSTYKIFQKDPSGPLSLLTQDAYLHVAWYPIYRVLLSYFSYL